MTDTDKPTFGWPDSPDPMPPAAAAAHAAHLATADLTEAEADLHHRQQRLADLLGTALVTALPPDVLRLLILEVARAGRRDLAVELTGAWAAVYEDVP